MSGGIKWYFSDVWLHFRRVFDALDIRLYRYQKGRSGILTIFYKIIETYTAQHLLQRASCVDQTWLPQHTTCVNNAQLYITTCLWILSNKKKDRQNNCKLCRKRKHFEDEETGELTLIAGMSYKTSSFCLSWSLCERSERILVKSPRSHWQEFVWKEWDEPNFR